jgi:uncharacterized protein (TIGR02266 family)
MANDRRSAPRASLAGIRATYEGAGGDPQDADAVNLSTGGIFLRSDAPLAVGKRVSLDLHVAGEAAPWSALGRIVWVRPADEGDERPAGMGVKLIDVEDTVVDAIERLVASREPTEPGVGESPLTPPRQAPPRERTMLSVGSPLAAALGATELPQAAEAPRHVPPAPAPLELPFEPTPTFPEATPEASLAIELVSKKVDSVRSPEPTTYADESIRVPKNRTGGRFFVFLLLVAAVAGVGFALRDRWPPLLHRARSAIHGGIERLR